tara:strand:- start:348 stop:527 length:180 start_codon:yes stop_codon:yes gene_type:complete
MAFQVKKWYASKTLWVGLVEAVFGILQFIEANPEVGTAALVAGVLTIALRFMTKSGLAK